MDSPEEPSERTRTKRGFHLLSISIFAFLLSSLMVALVAVFVGNLSVSSPVSVPSQCKIVSSSVDLRSSKVCELGLLNYKAKHVFYPLEKRKFRCHYDYYWASVFKVEYKDSLGQTRLTLTEAPNEALPLDCRPNFGAAWLTKDKFKVNETYDCWYASGISKVSIYQDSFFSCQAKEPSTIEMIRRYSILSTRILQSWLASQGRGKYWRLETVAGVITGFSTSLISISLVRILHQVKSSLPRILKRQLLLAVKSVRFRRAFFLVTYVIFMGWLAIEYGKRLGIANIYTVYYY